MNHDLLIGRRFALPTEHIMQQNLPMLILDKHYTSSGRSDDDYVEQWMKRALSVCHALVSMNYCNKENLRTFPPIIIMGLELALVYTKIL